MMEHNRQTQVPLFTFPKKSPEATELFGPNLAQNYLTLCLVICFKNFIEKVVVC